MSFEKFFNTAVSAWMSQEGPDSDIVLSSRIRLARNIVDFRFPTLFSSEEAMQIVALFERTFAYRSYGGAGRFELLKMSELQPIEKRVLVEKHLISPHLAEDSPFGACLLSENEEISIMINEEDHIRIQCLFPGLQLAEALEAASELDDWIEGHVNYAFDERLGYLTSCPTNVGTGLRASVMMHLPALVLTQQINRIIPAINQLGLVVRGTYGEGSEALGNIFQISNQLTLGKSEEDIIADLHTIVQQLIAQERAARQALVKTLGIQLEDKVFRSYGILANCRVIESKEAAQCLSDVRLGIDLGYIKNVSRNILNELMILTQPGFLQQYAGGALRPEERDVRRAALIRERLKMEERRKMEGDER
ncbi:MULTISPECIES: protein arginine kinase [Geobacillus]|jgi:protein arginine kinase|uniref:Protein-arginine kinase n=2 Tax=Geobacillus thermodenitrificans TaxID=33940 RepID=MCSB_GEOTN|nr:MULTISPECIES: protein arginine kinase [Geobacillus]A4IJG0.1 RecName: Full=Protein-arginine kinase [Geobacillus thermodenitrificans NG80-2]ABO65464.1 Arginine kinase [Geobacillus thermodenitrificans NG80-2]ARA98086.1 protein arginine kinase [Geobacillus thermodenitrificans]ARP41097.1 Putative ATP:guanido phosphotransferase [Geobacillus thermodenitrificans]ATO37445.1 protein arginine kinase [Geobacillus thermodenitrificans]KQB94924.1 putative ATP:guanido phosphotransferase [Geobacillus sp. P